MSKSYWDLVAEMIPVERAKHFAAETKAYESYAAGAVKREIKAGKSAAEAAKYVAWLYPGSLKGSMA